MSKNPTYFDMFPERVQIRAECKHGQLTRSCDMCEKDATIARLVEVLEVTAGNIRSLGPAGDLVPVPYRVWLAVVEDAIKGVKPAL